MLGPLCVSAEYPSMDWTQIHLAVNHIPVIGLPFLGLTLMVGWWRKSNELMRFALWSLVLMAGAAIAIKFTGDFAAEQSHDRFEVVRSLVNRHEETGDQVTTGVFILGLSSAFTLILARSGRPIRQWTVATVSLLALVVALLYLRTAHTGGQIRHPELRKTR